MMFRITPTTSAASIYGWEVLVGIGAGLTQQIGYSVGATVVQPHEVPAVIGFMNVAQIGSVAIALAISGAMFQNIGFIKLQQALAEYNFSTDDLRNALAGAQSIILGNSGEKVAGLAVQAIVDTIATIYALVIAAGALMLVCAVLMKREKLQLNPTAGG